MHAVFVDIVLAFIEGFALILSPCILPILPIILSGSLTGNKSRPLGIIIGFIILFTVITLFSRYLIGLLHIDPNVLRNISFVILFLLGIVMMSTYLTEKFTALTQPLLNAGSSTKSLQNTEGGWISGLIFGGLIGIIWTPCAGPILAAVIVQVITQHTTLHSGLIVVAFAIGAGAPMLLIALIGREIMGYFRFFRDKGRLVRKVLGFIIIVTVVYFAYASGAVLSYSSPVNNASTTAAALVDGLDHPYQAPPIAGIDAWINSSPLTLTDLKGKVVLIDFWTYSCINCLRTLPYIKSWYARYHQQGLEMIGVHAPEFQFEHDLNNVKNAVTKYGILYPVALDNNFVTWQNYHNEFWPAQYLINKDGYVVYEHFGEGDDATIENNIRYLLGLTPMSTNNNQAINTDYYQTPETYLGYARIQNFSSPEGPSSNAPALYSYPTTLIADHWALHGTWIIAQDKIIATTANSAIKLHFTAKHVYAVMGTSGNPIMVQVLLNGKAANPILVQRNQLYTVLNLDKPSSGTVELITAAPGLEMYTFTFGN